MLVFNCRQCWIIIVVLHILYAEREELAGPDYYPIEDGLQKWASQPGSVYLGGQKVQVQRPRLRRANQEVQLKSYKAMGQKKGFLKKRTNSSVLPLNRTTTKSGKAF
jgi:hypothetical protein